ncbi:MAG: GNAT family N-acetyltransferase [Lachnospiraceae bacterium]|nr:GNAT family N-acetyltransferase [Lachnospiraceae bacterium]
MDSITIRLTKAEDAERLLAIYEPYVLTTPITFEVVVPTLSDFRNRIRTISGRYPYLTALKNDVIVGYAYASAFKGRAAYDWSVETSIYMDQDYRGHGVGRMLYTALEACLKKQNICNVCACITYPNPASISFHEAFGYGTVAHFHKSGYKFGSWHDMIWMEKFIGEHMDEPHAFVPFSQILENKIEEKSHGKFNVIPQTNYPR